MRPSINAYIETNMKFRRKKKLTKSMKKLNLL